MTEASDLTGAYALNALTPEERAAVEARAAQSEATRNELTELQDTANVLALATDPVTPSADLKARLMAQIAVTPQLAPLETPAEHELAPVGPTPTELKTQSRWFSRPVLTLVSAAAAFVVLVGGGVLLSGVLSPENNAPIVADKLTQIRTADDAQQAVSPVAGGGTATLVWSGELASAALLADGLPELPAHQVYELWYINEGVARPAGTFTVDESGAVQQVLDGDMKDGDMVGVTIEPVGGSETPTTDPIVGIQA